MSIAALDQALAGAAIRIFDGEIADPLAALDHEAEIERHIAELEHLHTVLVATERKRGRIAERMDDPALAEQFPAGSLERLEAEDLLASIDRDLLVGYSAVTFQAGMILYHGRRIYGQRDLLADRLFQRGAMNRLRMTVPDMLTLDFFQEVGALPTEPPPPPTDPDPIFAQVPF
jgi:hypothetical protein